MDSPRSAMVRASLRMRSCARRESHAADGHFEGTLAGCKRCSDSTLSQFEQRDRITAIRQEQARLRKAQKPQVGLAAFPLTPTLSASATHSRNSLVILDDFFCFAVTFRQGFQMPAVSGTRQIPCKTAAAVRAFLCGQSANFRCGGHIFASLANGDSEPFSVAIHRHTGQKPPHRIPEGYPATYSL